MAATFSGAATETHARGDPDVVFRLRDVTRVNETLGTTTAIITHDADVARIAPRELAW